jgi:hypothetical protein
VVVAAGRDVIVDARPQESLAGIVLVCLSLVVMPMLAWFKGHTGQRLGSATLVADSAETLVRMAFGGAPWRFDSQRGPRLVVG